MPESALPPAGPPPSPSPGTGFIVLVPVKPPTVGKSRLVGLSDATRAALARAFALDTAEAALGAALVSVVLVVTDDAGFSAELTAIGCEAIPDGVSLDLNGTLRQAAAEAARRWPRLVPVALCADLPAMRSRDLDEALGEVTAHLDVASYVADAEGIGTTLYSAPHDCFEPQFGVASAALHGTRSRAVTAAVPTLRRDVDDLDDLREAGTLGLGPRTAALAEGLG